MTEDMVLRALNDLGPTRLGNIAAYLNTHSPRLLGMLARLVSEGKVIREEGVFKLA